MLQAVSAIVSSVQVTRCWGRETTRAAQIAIATNSTAM